LKIIDKYFVSLANNILNFQDLIITADNIDLKNHIIKKLSNTNKYNYSIYVIKTNDTWARDNSAITLLSTELATEKSLNNKKLVLDFEFNAWGGKYPYEFDNLVTEQLYNQHAFGDVDFKKIPYILEGGAIDTNGSGTVLTTSSVIFNNNRNKKLSNQDMINNLKKDLFIAHLIILNNSFLYGDDTDGHIDQLARFINKDTIVYAACNDSSNPNYNNLKKLEQELLSLDLSQLPFIPKLIPLFIPSVIKDQNNNILPASYINFLMLNKAILVPTYDNPEYDNQALNTFRTLLPDYEIIGLNSKSVIRHGGSLHCLTMQHPE
jgi:agmatine/peptidylarginine deiminase